MDTVKEICFWVVIGEIISFIAWLMDVPMTYNDMKFLLPICATLFSFNFAACSSCSNALLKFKENHQNVDISPVVQEMKESIIAMIVGIVIVLFSLFALNILEKPTNCYLIALKVGINGLIFSVFVMYIHLIYDIAVTFFDLIKN